MPFIIRPIILVLILLSIVGCSSTTLSYSPSLIHLKNKNFDYSFKGKSLHSTQVNLPPMHIEQDIFLSSFNDVLVYEYARINATHRFKYNYIYILNQVFEAKNVSKEYEKDGLGFFIIILKDETKVYALVKTGSKKYLTMLYGFSKENFKALMNKEDPIKSNSKKTEMDKAIKSKWNAKQIITGTLLQRVASPH